MKCDLNWFCDFHTWIQEFTSGGPGLTDMKKALTIFFSPQPIVQLGFKGYFNENFTFQKYHRGFNFFQGGGSNCLFI